MLLHCNGAVFLDLDQSPPVLPGPFHQSLLLPSFQVGVFPAKRVYQERESHSQESLPIERNFYFKFNLIYFVISSLNYRQPISPRKTHVTTQLFSEFANLRTHVLKGTASSALNYFQFKTYGTS